MIYSTLLILLKAIKHQFIFLIITIKICKEPLQFYIIISLIFLYIQSNC